MMISARFESMLNRFLLTILTLIFTHNAMGAENYVLKKDRVFSSDLEPVSGLKIFWWNVGCSSESGLRRIDKSIRHEFHPDSQFSNLEKLLEDDEFTPDLLILGEYCPRYFSDETEEALKDFYPHVVHVKKPNDKFKIRNGLIVFSKLELNVIREDVLSAGDFLEQDYMKTCAEKYEENSLEHTFDAEFWTRPLLELAVVKDDKPYRVVPVHLANPWRLINKCLNSKFYTGIELIRGTDNPNYVQSRQLAEDFEGSSSTVLIGDFNAARSVKGITSNSYRALSSYLGNSVIESDEFTFFDERSGFGSYSLDHAFVSDDLSVKREMVLPFAGSDHVPIYIIVE